jgi:heme/copper-type cytochrome/quinol oxidase subunit 2
MKKFILILLLMILMAVPMIGLTQPIEEAPRLDFRQGLETITNILFGILVIVSVIFILIGAYTILTAQGDAEKVNTGKNQVLYAIIAVIIGILAIGAIDFVLRQFGVQ